MDETIAALSALYQAEKTDSAYIFNTAMALMGAGVAYLVGMVAALEKFGISISWSMVLLLPSPLWLIAAFHSLITLNAMSHGASVRILEDALFRRSGLPNSSKGFVGSAAGDKIMDITASRWPHRLATVVVYAGVALLVLGFTLYSLFQAWHHVPLVARVSAVVGYALLILVVAASWIQGVPVVGDAVAKAKKLTHH